MDKLTQQSGWFWFYVALAAFNLWHPTPLGLVFGGLCIYFAVQQWQN